MSSSRPVFILRAPLLLCSALCLLNVRPCLAIRTDVNTSPPRFDTLHTTSFSPSLTLCYSLTHTLGIILTVVFAEMQVPASSPCVRNPFTGSLSYLLLFMGSCFRSFCFRPCSFSLGSLSSLSVSWCPVCVRCYPIIFLLWFCTARRSPIEKCWLDSTNCQFLARSCLPSFALFLSLSVPLSLSFSLFSLLSLTPSLFVYLYFVSPAHDWWCLCDSDIVMRMSRTQKLCGSAHLLVSVYVHY